MLRRSGLVWDISAVHPPCAVEFIVSDDHAGLRAARRAVLGAATWQRCQFHLAANAIHHAPNVAIRARIGAELRTVWNASTLVRAQAALDELLVAYRETAPGLAARLENAIPEGLAGCCQSNCNSSLMVAGFPKPPSF